MDMQRFEEAHQRVNENQQGFGDVKKVVVNGPKTIRLVGDFANNFEHFVQLPSGKRPYYCSGPSSDCALCALSAQLSVSDNESKQKVGDDIKAKEKFYFNCIPRDEEGAKWCSENNHSMLLTQNDRGNNIGSMLFNDIANVAAMRKQQGQPHSPTLYDIVVNRTGVKFQTKYTAQFTGQCDKLTDKESGYELYSVQDLARPSSDTDLKAAAQAIAAGEDDATSFNVQELMKLAPASEPAAQAVAQIAAASAPQAAPAPAVAPQAAPAAVQLKPVETAPAQPTFDPNKHVMVPCGACNAQIQVEMGTPDNITCGGCGKVYKSPYA